MRRYIVTYSDTPTKRGAGGVLDPVPQRSMAYIDQRVRLDAATTYKDIPAARRAIRKDRKLRGSDNAPIFAYAIVAVEV